MGGPIPIPDAGAYGIAVLALNSVGAFVVALHLHQTLPPRRRPDIWRFYAAVLGVVALGGLLVIDVRALFAAPLAVLAAAVPLGLAAGWAAGRLDRAVARRAHRRRLGEMRGAAAPSAGERAGSRGRGLRVERFVAGAARGPAEGRMWSPQRDFGGLARSLREPRIGLPTTIAIGALEEVLFRGFLIQLCLLLPGPGLAAAGIAATVALFALTHVWHGWDQVVAKAPLGALAALAVVLSGTVVPAIIAHVAFNVRAWRDQASAPAPAAAS